MVRVGQVCVNLNAIDQLFPNWLYHFILLITCTIVPASLCSTVNTSHLKISFSNHLFLEYKDDICFYLVKLGSHSSGRLGFDMDHQALLFSFKIGSVFPCSCF